MEDKEIMWDIGEIRIEKTRPTEDKLEKFADAIQGGSYTHLNEGYRVRVHFGEEGYSATDALKHYLKQMVQLKY